MPIHCLYLCVFFAHSKAACGEWTCSSQADDPDATSDECRSFFGRWADVSLEKTMSCCQRFGLGCESMLLMAAKGEGSLERNTAKTRKRAHLPPLSHDVETCPPWILNWWKRDRIASMGQLTTRAQVSNMDITWLDSLFYCLCTGTNDTSFPYPCLPSLRYLYVPSLRYPCLPSWQYDNADWCSNIPQTWEAGRDMLRLWSWRLRQVLHPPRPWSTSRRNRFAKDLPLLLGQKCKTRCQVEREVEDTLGRSSCWPRSRNLPCWYLRFSCFIVMMPSAVHFIFGLELSSIIQCLCLAAGAETQWSKSDWSRAKAAFCCQQEAHATPVDVFWRCELIWVSDKKCWESRGVAAIYQILSATHMPGCPFLAMRCATWSLQHSHSILPFYSSDICCDRCGHFGTPELGPRLRSVAVVAPSKYWCVGARLQQQRRKLVQPLVPSDLTPKSSASFCVTPSHHRHRGAKILVLSKRGTRLCAVPLWGPGLGLEHLRTRVASRYVADGILHLKEWRRLDKCKEQTFEF